VTIAGRTVVLRPVEDADVPLIHRWMNDAAVWRGMDYERPFSLADVRDDVARSRDEGHPFTIVVDGRLIGRIGLNGFRRRDRIASMYLYVGEPDRWGKGYGTDAVLALLGFAFDRLDLARVELWALGDNAQALAMYRACGFAEDARLPERSFKDGAWVDRVVMSVTRAGFARRLGHASGFVTPVRMVSDLG
jgi:RimJ/RimL family protein N-acetyltransferase